MKNTALMIVDVQQGLIDLHPYRADALLADINALSGHARAHGAEVIYVRHGEDDRDGLYPGSPAWQIHPAIRPEEGERIFDKRFSSAFKNTGLDKYLKSKGIQTLVVCGMQTEYCIDATMKSAFERDYTVIMPQGCTTTYDTRIAPAGQLVEFYEKDIWDGRFASVIPLAKGLDKLG